jgi:hypothetical protein
MKFYYFGGFIDKDEIDTLESSGFTGVLFTYDNQQGDLFTKIAHTIDPSQKLKYLVAMRTYAMSPQYLSMINQSFSTIGRDRLQINLIAGHTKEHEEKVGGIIGDVNDLSSKVEKSNYLIEFLHSINNITVNKNIQPYVPDFYVSTTNRYVFDVAKQYNNKIIIQYKDYKKGSWTEYNEHGRSFDGEELDLTTMKTMLSIGPRVRKTQEELDKVPINTKYPDTEKFTYEEFEAFVDNLEEDGIDEILMFCWPVKEKDYVIDFVKEYTAKRGRS